MTSQISDKALRYDLTVPFARFVVQHQNELALPFKRYQIQPVWRADRPQKGRFREFYQCDADVVGAMSLWQEVDLIQLYDTVFSELGLLGDQHPTLRINHRKILAGIAESFGIEDQLIPFTVALDKLDKIGAEGVLKELNALGLSDSVLEKVDTFLKVGSNLTDQLNFLDGLFVHSEQGRTGVDEIRFLLDQLEAVRLESIDLKLDLTLARGLNYYTGIIFEVSAPEGVQMGSIGGGGRYDNLTSQFGGQALGGVGISFGLDRIYLVLEALGLFPENVSDRLDVFIINYDDQSSKQLLPFIQKLRKAGVSVELYPLATKIQKQFKYLDKRTAQLVLFPKSELLAEDKIEVKNLSSGEVSIFEISEIDQIKKALS
jgi:histidyl-tRNA synthetase